MMFRNEKRAFCTSYHPRQQKWCFLDFIMSLTNTKKVKNRVFAMS